jgi:acyl carrier protein
MSDTLDKVRSIVADQAMMEADAVKPDSTMTDLGIDSLGLVEIVFAIEEAFDVTIPYNANDPAASDFDISTVQAAADGVDRLVAEKA